MTLLESQRAVLLVDRPRVGLRAGGVGVVVHVYPGTTAYEVEFLTADGDTISVETLAATEVTARGPRQVLHVRPLTAA